MKSTIAITVPLLLLALNGCASLSPTVQPVAVGCPARPAPPAWAVESPAYADLDRAVVERVFQVAADDQRK